MLTIRKDQQEAFAAVARERFVETLVGHFLQHYPRESRQAGGRDQIEKVVRQGIDRAGAHGFETEGQVSRFVALQVMLGGGFDRDPQLAFVTQAIDDEGAIADPTSRIESVYNDALDYLGDAAGENAGYIVRAMVRVRDWDPSTAPQSSGPQWIEDMCPLLAKLYPQKYALQGEDATRRMLSGAQAKCEGYRITGPRGMAMIAILSFFLGSGFDRDLLHPWAQAVLTAPQLEETARVDQLYAAAMAHMNESFQSN